MTDGLRSLGEGWGFPASSRKAHYFRETVSLCGKYGLYMGPLEPDNGLSSPDDCAACRRKFTALSHHDEVMG